MNSLTRYMVNPLVSCGDEEDGAVLFDPDTDNTIIINLSGRAIWAFLEAPRTVDEIAAYLVETFRSVSAEQALQDAAQFIESLMPDFVFEAHVDD